MACTLWLKMDSFSALTASFTIGSMADFCRPMVTGVWISYLNSSPASVACAIDATLAVIAVMA